MNMQIDFEALAHDLADVRDQMMELLNQAESIMGDGPEFEYARAKGYWIGHMKAALGGYGYTSMCSMQDSVSELEAVASDEVDANE
jgi:hypothetical protein